MGASFGVRHSGGVEVTTPTDHFDVSDGSLSPQPWMQMRQVSTASTPSVARTYASTGGQNKNEVYQTLSVSWTNNTPLSQWSYGMVHHGGSAVALQARSRGYLRISHSVTVALAPKAEAPSPLVEVSRFGGGSDIGVGGILGIGTDFAMHEVRAHSTTVPLMPNLTGWFEVPPGHTITGAVEVRFVSEKWESTSITNGKSNTDCTVLAGDVRIDLWAVPIIEDPPARSTPTIIGSNAKMESSKSVTVATPAGTQYGDVLLAIVGNNFGDATAMTAPAGWKLLHAVNNGQFDWFTAHVKVYARQVGVSEPAKHTFTNAFGAEQIVQVITLRGAVAPSSGVDANGWSIASTRTKYNKRGDLHVAPSMAVDGQLLICASFFGLADNIWDGFGVVQVKDSAPDGMTELLNLNGTNSNMCVATLADPPNPTQERVFTTEPRAYFAGDAVSVAIVVAGTQQF